MLNLQLFSNFFFFFPYLHVDKIIGLEIEKLVNVHDEHRIVARQLIH